MPAPRKIARKSVASSPSSQRRGSSPPASSRFLNNDTRIRMLSNPANVLMEGALPLDSFQEELERHAVINPFASSLFQANSEVQQQDGRLKLEAFPQRAVKALTDGFVDLASHTWSRSLQTELGKIERQEMSTIDFRNFLEQDFTFATQIGLNTVNAILGRDTIYPPSPAEEESLISRINRFDTSLLTDPKALIMIALSPACWLAITRLWKEMKGYAEDIQTWLRWLVSKVRGTARQNNLPQPPDLPGDGGGGGGMGGGGGPGGGGPGGGPGGGGPGGGGNPPGDHGNPPNDPTLPPSQQQAPTADPTLETHNAGQSGSGGHENTHSSATSAPISNRVDEEKQSATPPPVQQHRVQPQFTGYFATVIALMLAPTAAIYYAYRHITSITGVIMHDRRIDAVADEIALNPNTGTTFRRLLTEHVGVALGSVAIRSMILTTAGGWMEVNRLFANHIEDYIVNAVANAGTGEPIFGHIEDLAQNAIDAVSAAQMLLDGMRKDARFMFADLMKVLEDFIANNRRPDLAQQVPGGGADAADGIVNVMDINLDERMQEMIIRKADYQPEAGSRVSRVNVNDFIKETLGKIQDVLSTRRQALSKEMFSRTIALALTQVGNVGKYLISPYSLNDNPMLRNAWSRDFSELSGYLRSVAGTQYSKAEVLTFARNCLSKIDDYLTVKTFEIAAVDTPTPFLTPFLTYTVELIRRLVPLLDRGEL